MLLVLLSKVSIVFLKSKYMGLVSISRCSYLHRLSIYFLIQIENHMINVFFDSNFVK